ncbi:hypothetical protein V0288_07930 [Pannus brasiliensis CCIBt3594]|uniref:Uncharacterized protein n=1 Tax=Pannus brasiliensis CCIBt3594 TaxID=1427578 RepID=A0AAW9QJ77_9CHRO
MPPTIPFNQLLEIIETLSPEELDDLINIVRNRQIERRRAEIAASIAEAHQEYQQGKVFRGTADDIIAELER